MTREQIQQAIDAILEPGLDGPSTIQLEQVYDFVMKVAADERADEREACAQICEQRILSWPSNAGSFNTLSEAIAAAIRARGQA